jgi:predicted aspartyl protease
MAAIMQQEMGMFQVKVRVANTQDPARAFEDLFWVDTGALYSYVPEDRLFAIGLSPRGTRQFILADGRHEQRPLGEAHFTIDALGETMTCPVVFAGHDSLLLLGATALENFCVQADPATQTLKPVTAVIGTHLTFRV